MGGRRAFPGAQLVQPPGEGYAPGIFMGTLFQAGATPGAFAPYSNAGQADIFISRTMLDGTPR